MIRAACAASLLALSLLAWMLSDTDGHTAIAFSFVGHGSLALAVGLYAYATWGPVRMSGEEAELYKLAFSSLPRRDFVKIAALGRWEEFSPGDRLIRSGERVDRVRVLLRGRVRAEVNGAEVGSVGPGELVGSTPALTDTEAWGDAVAIEPGRALSWEVGSLEALLEGKPELRSALQGIVSRDLALKLQRLTQRR